MWLEHGGEGEGCLRGGQRGGLGPLYTGHLSEDRELEVDSRDKGKPLEILNRGVT